MHKITVIKRRDITINDPKGWDTHWAVWSWSLVPKTAQGTGWTVWSWTSLHVAWSHDLSPWSLWMNVQNPGGKQQVSVSSCLASNFQWDQQSQDQDRNSSNVCLIDNDLSCPFEEDCWAPPLSTHFSSRWSMMLCPWLCACRKCAKLIQQKESKEVTMVKSFAVVKIPRENLLGFRKGAEFCVYRCVTSRYLSDILVKIKTPKTAMKEIGMMTKLKYQYNQPP